MCGIIKLVLVLILTGYSFSTSYDDGSYSEDYVEGLEEEILRIPDIVGFHMTIDKRDNYTYNFTCVAKCDYNFEIKLYVDDEPVQGLQIQSEHDPSIFHMTVTGPAKVDTNIEFKCIAESAHGLTTDRLSAMPHGMFQLYGGFHLPLFISRFDKHNCDFLMSYYLLPDNFPISVISANENSTDIVYDSRAQTKYVNDTNCDTESILTRYDIAGFEYSDRSGIFFTFEKTVEHKEEEYYPAEVSTDEPDPMDNGVYQPPEITSVGFTLADLGNNFVELKLECSAEHEDHMITWYVPGREIVEHNRSHNEIKFRLSKDDMMTHEYICQVFGGEVETSEIYLTISSVMNFETIQKYSALFLFQNNSKEAIFNVHLNKNHVITPENVFIEGKHKTFYAKKDANGVFYARGKLENLMSKYKFYTDLHKKYQLNFEISRKTLFTEYYEP